MPNPRARFLRARRDRPYSLVFSLTFWIPGVLALIYGEAVSRGLTELGAGFMSRIMGAALVLGSLTASYGILSSSHFAEVVGVTGLMFGCLIYGIGVVFGLGLAGSVAGSLAMAIVVGSALRATSVSHAARGVASSG